MVKITFQKETYYCHEGESVLQVFLRNGVTVPFSCQKGICHVCLLRSSNVTPSASAQDGLRANLVELGYFKACNCVPERDMAIELPRDSDMLIPTAVSSKEYLSGDVCRLLLEPASQFNYKPGQFINLYREDGETRSYSLASIPRQDYFLELHIKRIEGGVFSNWLFHDLAVGDELNIQGPGGNCCYVNGDKDQAILLVGTGTGLAPLLGVVRDALTHGHRGDLYLYHGSHSVEGLYLDKEMRQLTELYTNFYYIPCISGEQVPDGYRKGRANDIAMHDIPNLVDWRLYLCGQPEMVESMTGYANTVGINPDLIHADPFWKSLTDKAESENSASVNKPPEFYPANQLTIERRKYPEADPEMWQALNNGDLLTLILKDFYTLVYDDPRLAPFFNNTTKQRSIEKQYNFLCQVFTGQDVYFGERPRNAHHWMVITNELFDYREDIMESCLRAHKLPEHLIKRWRSMEELYREDIVKDKPWKKIMFGKELPLEGFDELVLDEATLCDNCQQEISSGQRVRYHLRLGTVYCPDCMQNLGQD